MNIKTAAGVANCCVNANADFYLSMPQSGDRGIKKFSRLRLGYQNILYGVIWFWGKYDLRQLWAFWMIKPKTDSIWKHHKIKVWTAVKNFYSDLAGYYNCEDVNRFKSKSCKKINK